MKNKLIENIDFINECQKYNISLNEANYKEFENIILVLTPMRNLYIILDKNFNTIGVSKKDSSLSDEEFAHNFYNSYKEFTDILPFGEEFSVPFTSYTLKDFIDISSKIQIGDDSLIIDNHCINKENEFYKEYLGIFSYIKFIGEELKRLFLLNYHLEMMRLDEINPYEYVRSIMKNIKATISYFNHYGRVATPIDVINRLGEDAKKYKNLNILSNVIDVILHRQIKAIRYNNSEFNLDELGNNVVNLFSNGEKVEIDNKKRILNP